ncbi:MAG: glycosyltransferase [Isosphaeraceae bacterium]
MPRVTVITPNYNHARYLPQRLESILNQTFQDFELIILDNASTDNSREVIQSYTSDPRVRAIFNAENNGSTFKQWNLGLSHANGEYIWFAESDDYADPTLLETLVDRLDRHPNVGLAFCQSWAVDENSNILYNFVDYFAGSSPSPRWRKDYINSGPDEAMNYLFWYNTIPNASAVLLRRGILERAGGVPDDLLLAGDVMTYINVLSISDIAFVSDPLNFHRQHPDTVRGRTLKQGIVARELRVVHSALIKRYGFRRLLRAEYGFRRLLGGKDEALTMYVQRLIWQAKRPPDNIVPPGEVLALLFWFARIQPVALRIALPILTRQVVADLARRVGLLGLARKLKNALAKSTH